MTSTELIKRCRELRKNPTEAEAFLWEYLRRKQIKGLKIRRQHPMYGYILDFYCIEAQLGIELDGSVHSKQEQSDYDDARTLELSDYNVKILRFWNSEVFKNVDSVVDRICAEIEIRINELSVTSLTPNIYPKPGSGKQLCDSTPAVLKSETAGVLPLR